MICLDVKGTGLCFAVGGRSICKRALVFLDSKSGRVWRALGAILELLGWNRRYFALASKGLRAMKRP